jgi:hypothetical protein
MLLALYPDTLQCPCTRISIPYNTFINQLAVASFHPVCKINFVTGNWLYYYSDYTLYFPNWISLADFRYWNPSFFRVLAMFCALAQDNVADSLLTFGSSTFITDQVMPRALFDKQMNGTLDYIQTSIPLAFARTLELVRTIIQGNALLTAYSTNWKLVLTSKNRNINASFLSMPVSYGITQNNTICSCATSRLCSMPGQILYPNSTPSYSLKGIVVGCLMIESVLLSSLSCLCSPTCLAELTTETYSIVGFGRLDAFSIPINMSSSRFSGDETIETIAQAMFIDSWTSNMSYKKYYNACAHSYCSFTYHYRFDTLEVLSAFLSLYGGLALGLRFVVPHLVRIVIKVRNRFRVTPL